MAKGLGASPTDVSVGATQWAGNEFARQPDVTAALNSTYRGMLSNGWKWSIRGDMTYTGRAWDTIANIVQSDDYYRVNARIGMERDNLAIELFVTNLFDDNTWNYMSRTTTSNEAGQGSSEHCRWATRPSRLVSRSRRRQAGHRTARQLLVLGLAWPPRSA